MPRSVGNVDALDHFAVGAGGEPRIGVGRRMGSDKVDGHDDVVRAVGGKRDVKRTGHRLHEEHEAVARSGRRAVDDACSFDVAIAVGKPAHTAKEIGASPMASLPTDHCAHSQVAQCALNAFDDGLGHAVDPCWTVRAYTRASATVLMSSCRSDSETLWLLQ